MSALELQVYELFKKRFSEEEAKTVIQYFESKAEEKTQQKKDLFLTKDDKVDLIDRINKSKVETIVWIVGTGVVQFMLTILAKRVL
jgi:excinuclease UvrABC helicase subunit UvrB